VSNFTPDLLVEAIETLDAPVVANQVECHPMLQQRELRAACTDHDVELVGYSPLAQGDVLDVEELQSIAATRDATPAQVSLAWALARDVVPIPKATGDHVRENWAALELEFSDEELERIDGLDGGDRRVDPEPAPWA